MAAVTVLAIGMAGLLVGFRSTGGASVPVETVPPVVPDLRESARLVVGDFVTAWNEGDATAAAELIAADWDRVMLPGFADALFNQRDGREELEEAIGFLTRVATLSLGPCDARIAPPDDRASALLVCEEAGFEGPYLEAVAVNIWSDLRPESAPVGIDGMVFEIRDGRILGIEVDTTRYTPQAYCMWRESQPSGAAGTFFNVRCHPTTDPADAGFHAEAAGRYLEAGAPLPTRRDAFYRLIAGFVEQFVDYHNAGAVFDIERWIAGGVDPSAFPGFAGGSAGELNDYLQWTTRLAHIEAGDCSVDVGSAATIVTCPELTVSGPVFAGETLQPTRFVLDHPTAGRGRPARGWITGMERLAGRADLTATCRALAGTAAASAAFDADCNPIYTRTAAEAILEELG